ncbi:hypothetical protein ACIRBX_32360 [Kitasatospora sp. NPDC096147]|uniref:hypothetical protein n=1 Tax=Kitasatospora sp. NPDC096147 TaxID=3364093 RepID=UPI0038259755
MGSVFWVLVVVVLPALYFLAPAVVAGWLAVLLTRRLPWYVRLIAMPLLPALSTPLCRTVAEAFGLPRAMIGTVIAGLLAALAALHREERRRPQAARARPAPQP